MDNASSTNQQNEAQVLSKDISMVKMKKDHSKETFLAELNDISNKSTIFATDKILSLSKLLFNIWTIYYQF